MAAHARLHKVSMYSELLAGSLRAVERDEDGPQGPASEEALRRALGDCRGRLASRAAMATRLGTPVPADVPADIARQLDYDLVLIQVCRLHGIEAEPGRFTRPAAERQRLEAALVAAGVDLSDAVAGDHLAGASPHEPPDGASRS